MRLLFAIRECLERETRLQVQQLFFLIVHSYLADIKANYWHIPIGCRYVYFPFFCFINTAWCYYRQTVLYILYQTKIRLLVRISNKADPMVRLSNDIFIQITLNALLRCFYKLFWMQTNFRYLTERRQHSVQLQTILLHNVIQIFVVKAHLLCFIHIRINQPYELFTFLNNQASFTIASELSLSSISSG